MSRDDSNLSDFSMLDLFRMELDTQLAVLNDGLLEIENSGVTPHLLESLMRAAHSIKGAARMVDVNAVVRVAHIIEECFVLAQNRSIKLVQSDFDKLLEGLDTIAVIRKAKDDEILDWEKSHDQELNRIEMGLIEITRRSGEEKIVNTQNELDAKLIKDAEQQKVQSEELGGEENSLRVDVDRINRILSLAGESLVESHRLSGIMDTFLQFKKKQHTLVDALDEMRILLQESGSSRIVKEQFTKVYSSALGLRQEMNEKVNELDSFDRRNALLIERLHEEIRATRMRPFSVLVQPYPRLVRDLGRQLKKTVKINMSGLAVLVDRDVLERIDTSLKHLLQNAIDHGIESPDVRKEKGKAAEGKINLNVSQSAGMLFVVIEDDGGGVDLGLLKQKVVKKGYVESDQVDSLDTASLLDFMFMPGFSTKSRANQISGRGVGLDLVRETMESLGGSIYATSIPGEGTRFQILLPQMVSIMRVLLTHVNGELYSFPLSRVHRVLRVERSSISKNENGYCCFLEDGVYQLVTISQLLGYGPMLLGRTVDVVLIREESRNIGIIVESILGQREVSIQRLDSDLGEIPGVNAASILDTGDLSLIFDTKALVGIYESLQRKNKVELPKLHHDGNNRVMLVSDSANIREQSKRFLNANNFQINADRFESHVIERILGQLPNCLVLSSDIGFTNLMNTLERVTETDALKSMGVVVIMSERDRRLHGDSLLESGVPLLDHNDVQRQVFLKTIREAVEKSKQ